MGSLARGRCDRSRDRHAGVQRRCGCVGRADPVLWRRKVPL